MVENKVSLDGCNREQVGPRVDGTVAALEGTKGEKQKTQSFASFSAAYMALDDNLSSQGPLGHLELSRHISLRGGWATPGS